VGLSCVDQSHVRLPHIESGGLGAIATDPKGETGLSAPRSWHLDNLTYNTYHDHKNWLIMYLPVLKPQADRSNVAVMPYDVLERLDPRTAARVRGRGSMRFKRVSTDTLEHFRAAFPEEQVDVGDMFAIDDYDDMSVGWKLTVDLDEHRHVPQLEECDLLVMAADIIHRTDDASSVRVSLRFDVIPAEVSNLSTWWKSYFANLKIALLNKKYQAIKYPRWATLTTYPILLWHVISFPFKAGFFTGRPWPRPWHAFRLVTRYLHLVEDSLGGGL